MPLSPSGAVGAVTLELILTPFLKRASVQVRLYIIQFLNNQVDNPSINTETLNSQDFLRLPQFTHHCQVDKVVYLFEDVSLFTRMSRLG